jgi:inorganic pyrophosphatase
LGSTYPRVRVATLRPMGDVGVLGASGDADDAEPVREADIQVFIEIPKGSRNKYEWDHHSRRFRLDRMLFSAVQYPGDYGFVLDTFGEDGDPLDALVILSDPTFPGCVIDARVVGVFWMTDDKGRDTKILTVPESDPRWRDLRDLDDVPRHFLDEIGHFFSIYKDLERKTVTVEGFGSRAQALDEVNSSRERFRTMDDPPAMP